jgi:hypothetical protein
MSTVRLHRPSFSDKWMRSYKWLSTRTTGLSACDASGASNAGYSNAGVSFRRNAAIPIPAF